MENMAGADNPMSAKARSFCERLLCSPDENGPVQFNQMGSMTFCVLSLSDLATPLFDSLPVFHLLNSETVSVADAQTLDSQRNRAIIQFRVRPWPSDDSRTGSGEQQQPLPRADID